MGAVLSGVFWGRSLSGLFVFRFRVRAVAHAARVLVFLPLLIFRISPDMSRCQIGLLMLFGREELRFRSFANWLRISNPCICL